jgi:16S rRNA processing protein RimM
MIIREEVVKIGQFQKPHGIKGEISFHFTNDSFDESDCPFLICELDGILVPFKIEECRFKSDSTAFVKLKNIPSDERAKILINKEVYFPKKYIRENRGGEPFLWNYFIGFTLVDESAGKIGIIQEVDESTMNTLFIVQGNQNEEILIPAHEEMITHIQEDLKEIYVQLPEGLLDSNFKLFV